ncbi:E1-like protein-activating [Gonapodya prolifera JEL478]|uniref:Ubiquitin-like modifier-activating enzyme ATG7 n=1 Tax=Gonapodya prolifera (strain JEL478) TaxID=1344416 RepID=A0A139ANK5_GONPJ|nr:E1-like protein-activating [Gonapodya prolifera JEL478]|eukprot:KXS18308.1 E1-like protein-activating [Gonapodya prolifera JEL478]
MSPLQFSQFTCAVSTSFWHRLRDLKLDAFRLDDQKRQIWASYSLPSHDATNSPPIFSLGYEAFTDLAVPPAPLDVAHLAIPSAADGFPSSAIPVPGTIINTNTLDEFKSLDKRQALADAAQLVWDDIQSGAALACPDLLSRFLLVTFADLKKFKFYYWFAFPSFSIAPTPAPSATPPEASAGNPWTVTLHAPPRALGDDWSASDISSLVSAVKQHTLPPSSSTPVFFISRHADTIQFIPLSSASSYLASTTSPLLLFIDPSSLPTNPAWPLRNILALLRLSFSLSRIDVLAFRGLTSSLILPVTMSGLPSLSTPPTGWVPNAKGQLLPRLVDLSSAMDPRLLSASAVALNLKLMKWRVVPELDLERVAKLKCLLVGSGTLGCYVARALAAWDVRHITFLDNGTVAHSNPVRQPLFSFDDALNARPKAQAAADGLKAVVPGVTATSISLNVPMPGHPAGPTSRDDFTKLAELVASHDAIFCLTDSRESRWLPTLLGAAGGKLVINAALGFDTYVVMRHGPRTAPSSSSGAAPSATARPAPALSPDVVDAQDLGCYFCGDVVAPGDSLANRTLDQMCTVTRPGIAQIAAAMAAELMVSVVSHHLGSSAPAPSQNLAPSAPIPARTSTPLGCVPHQMRGFLTHWQNLVLVGRRFDGCVACSDEVHRLYATDGYAFIERVLNDPSYLERVSGLQAMKDKLESLDMEPEDDDGFEALDDE